MWGRAGALCLFLVGVHHLAGHHYTVMESSCNKDKHKAPASTQPCPLSLQMRGTPVSEHNFQFWL